ncbi:hypothetical protein M1O24_02465 [Dehalococcoidia bacterium]|nr:hypothetical protein [Dehalococcoidia bacterium]
MDEMSRVLRDGGRIFIYTRLRSQNARNIWGRHFPLFLEKESRLHELWEMEEMTKLIDSLVVESIKKFKYWRNSTLSRLINQARNSHYSTFSLSKGRISSCAQGVLREYPQQFQLPRQGGVV